MRLVKRTFLGTGPLDDVAKRQIKYLIQPSPDGSHRPKPAFGGPRATPSGGFYPHAPNAIKVSVRIKQDFVSFELGFQPEYRGFRLYMIIFIHSVLYCAVFQS